MRTVAVDDDLKIQPTSHYGGAATDDFSVWGQGTELVVGIADIEDAEGDRALVAPEAVADQSIKLPKRVAIVRNCRRSQSVRIRGEILGEGIGFRTSEESARGVPIAGNRQLLQSYMISLLRGNLRVGRQFRISVS